MAMQTFKGKVIKIEQLTHDVIRFSLTAPEDFTFQAGQFMTFMIKKEEVKKPRSYSILNPPSRKGPLEFVVKFVENGFASSVFKEMKEGQEFEVKGPLGHFTFAENKEKHWFIGCGTGIVPFHSLLKEYLLKYPKKKFTLLFSVKTKKDLFLYNEFKELEKESPNFTYIPSLTREEWEGKCGRVQKHLPDDLKNKTFYICGLKELVEDTKELLLKKGVNPKDIKTERYN